MDNFSQASVTEHLKPIGAEKPTPEVAEGLLRGEVSGQEDIPKPPFDLEDLIGKPNMPDEETDDDVQEEPPATQVSPKPTNLDSVTKNSVPTVPLSANTKKLDITP